MAFLLLLLSLPRHQGNLHFFASPIVASPFSFPFSLFRNVDFERGEHLLFSFVAGDSTTNWLLSSLSDRVRNLWTSFDLGFIVIFKCKSPLNKNFVAEFEIYLLVYLSNDGWGLLALYIYILILTLRLIHSFIWTGFVLRIFLYFF